MFGNFSFGKGRFAQGDLPTSGPVTGTATFTGFQLHIVCRGVVSHQSAGIDQRWIDKLLGKKKRKKARQAVEPIWGIVKISGGRLQVAFHTPVARPGSVGRFCNPMLQVSTRPILIRCGVRARFGSGFHIIETRPPPKGATAKVRGCKVLNRSHSPPGIGVYNPSECEMLLLLSTL